MNSIQTPSLPKEKKRFFFLFLLCSLAFTSVALGGVSLIRFDWPSNYHPYTNNAKSAVLEAEWIVYPNGLDQQNDFYLTATSPHSNGGGEILFRYWAGTPYFGLTDYCDDPAYPCPDTLYTSLNDHALEPYYGTRVINGESFTVLRYRLSNRRTTGAGQVDLVCTNRSATIAAASNGATLPQSTIYVNSTRAFPTSGKIQIVVTSFTNSPTISYGGTTVNSNGHTTSFTGCTGGTGTLATGQVLGELSGNTTNATHFQNTIYLFNYTTQTWDTWYDHEYNWTAFLHDCTTCDNVCAYWGPMFESNYCGLGFLPPIGVVDMLMSVNDGPFVRGNNFNSIFVSTLSACGSNPYQVWSYLPRYRWIINTTP